ncbi:hypothetical protein VTN96DRAFT_9814 [Rasamsonia emersonii]
MNISSNLQRLQRRINEIRVENADSKRFVPERELYDVMTRDVIAKVVVDFTPFDHSEEVVDFIINGAQKVFGVLVLIGYVGYLEHFIRKDQLQARPVDDLLPLAKPVLQEILNDNYIAELFHEKQWEFCVPVFSGRIIPRAFERQTILPYLADSFLSAGGYGSVHKVEIHPSHRPQNFETTTVFVRKELELDDSTYENEVRVLSTLQRLQHPNILKLVGCYTYNSKHNLIFPYIPDGTLRKFLKQEKPPNLTREEMFCSVAGLASATWALHEFALEDTEPSHKGHHQDLRPDNILVDGDRFILADFGLSSIKSMEEVSKTPFKGRRGYCQAPECADLGHPYQEHETTRATDIFSLGCIIADILIYLVKGPAGVEKFNHNREFHMPPMCYYLYHKGESSNEAVAASLKKVADEDGSQSMRDVVQLVSSMLEILPNKRPAAAAVTATLYLSIIKAFAEQFTVLFAQFTSSFPDAFIEEARFQSWAWSQDSELYSSSSGATTTAKIFDSTIEILRQMKHALESIDENASDLDCRSFLEVRTLNTQLLNMLSPERRSSARSRLESILLANMEPGSAVYQTLRSAFGDSRLTQIADTKHLVAQVEGATTPLTKPSFKIISGPIAYTRQIGQYKIAKIRRDQHGQGKWAIVETIQYQDQLRRQRLLPRIYALCDLLTTDHLRQQLCIPPFHGLKDNVDAFCFEMVYDFPNEHKGGLSGLSPLSLRQLLTEREPSKFPSWESRLKLGFELAESLAAFHDVNWFHKDLTSFSVLFFPTHQTSPSARASRPYLLGFQHSRSAIDDFTEGPLQDRKHHRYHDPRYICVENHQFTRFRPQFDYYSLGILLVEIGFWDTIDAVMDEYKNEDNHVFSASLIKHKLPTLSFSMGSRYANIVKQCLTGLGEQAPTNLLFKQKVVMPLKSLNRFYPAQEPEPDRKREREGEGEITRR